MTNVWSGLPYGRAGQADPKSEPIAQSQLGNVRPAARRHGLLSKVAANTLSLWRTAIGKPLARPLAKVRARQVDVGFPFRSDPVPPPVEPDRDCDCVPLEWL